MASWLNLMMAFLSIPKYESELIHDICKSYQNNFWSLKVLVTINNVNWKTSLFFDTKNSCYHLPVKSLIRKKANIKEWDLVKFV